MPRTRLVPLLAAAAALGAAVAAPTASATTRGPSVTATAIHPKIVANGTSTSRIVVKVRVGRSAAKGVLVTLSLGGSPGTACGSLRATSGRTNRDGIFSTTYRSSTTSGFCTTKAAVGSRSGAAVIDQTSPTASTPYTVTLSSAATQLHPDQIVMLSIAVDNDSAGVSGDPVMITMTALQAGACGSIPGALTTSSAGTVTTRYYASPHDGNCQLKATDAQSGGTSNAVVVNQSGKPIV